MHLSTRAVRARGFTLVELTIVFAVIAILVLLALPSFNLMIRNAQLRSVAEALQNGLRLAQAEAVRSQRLVVFVRTNQAPGLNAVPDGAGANWMVLRRPLGVLDAGAASATRAADGTEFVEGGNFGTLTSGVTISGLAAICFDADGRFVTEPSTLTGLPAPGQSCGANAGSFAKAAGGFEAARNAVNAYTVTRPNVVDGEDRPLVVTVSVGGGVRMCDPAKTVSADNPDGC